MTENGSGKVTSLNVTVRHDQKAMVRQYAKDRGLVSLSEAARHILDEYAALKAAQHGVKLES